MTTTFTANGAEFIAKDDMIVRWLRQGNSEFEPYTTSWMFDRLKEREGVYLDVGASTGWFAVPAAMQGHEVVAVECNPRVLRRLRENAGLNNVSFEIHAVAASDTVGEAVFRHNPAWPLTSGGSLEAGIRGHRADETVRTDTLDGIVAGRRVAVLKMDVEGHEMAALAGAKNTLTGSRPFLVLEANTPTHEADLAAFLAENGYTYVKADHRNMLCSPA